MPVSCAGFQGYSTLRTQVDDAELENLDTSVPRKQWIWLSNHCNCHTRAIRFQPTEQAEGLLAAAVVGANLFFWGYNLDVGGVRCAVNGESTALLMLRACHYKFLMEEITMGTPHPPPAGRADFLLC